MDKSTTMGLSMTTSKKLSYSRNKVSNYTILKLSIYYFPHLVNQLTPTSFIL